MDSRDERPYRSGDGQPRLRRYVVQATKAILCISGWVGIFALLFLYGPAAMSVSDGAATPLSIVSGAFAVLLSAGSATVLTIILSVFVLGAIGWQRNQTAESQDDTDAMEDESHA
jgi:hypothetical protein